MFQMRLNKDLMRIISPKGLYEDLFYLERLRIFEVFTGYSKERMFFILLQATCRGANLQRLSPDGL